MRSNDADCARFTHTLKQQLGSVPDRGFLELVWAANILQSDRPEGAYHVFGPLFPKAALGADVSSKCAIHPWELETLVNELLAIEKIGATSGNKTYRVLLRHWNSLAQVAQTLRHLENAEYGAHCDPKNVLRELARIAARQFEWQRGHVSVPQLYRACYLYGGPLAASHLESKHGTSVSELTQVGFAIFAATQEWPAIQRSIRLDAIGAHPGALERVLNRISRPLYEMRAIAREQRSGWPFTAYKPSILRKFPCISLPGRRPAVLTPLPDLVLDRVTSGIFYDLVGAEGGIRDEYGRRFESYCKSYIQAQLPSLEANGGSQYRVRKQAHNTPDILVKAGNAIVLAIECKATKMRALARFEDQSNDERGFGELARGVYQIWRFFAHSRQGWTGCQLEEGVVGMVLTLDGWLVASSELREEVLQKAKALAARDNTVEHEDLKPVIFCQVTDLESTLAEADEKTFIEAVRRLARREGGWMLSSVHAEIAAVRESSRRRKAYPFKDLAEIIPWWGDLENDRDRRVEIPA